MDIEISAFFQELMLKGGLPILFAIISVLAFRVYLAQPGHAQQPTDDNPLGFQEAMKVRGFLDWMVVKFLLPSILIILYFTEDAFDGALQLVSLGFFATFLTLYVSKAVFKIVWFDNKLYWLPALCSTFGGGNRGVMLLIIFAMAGKIVGSDWGYIIATFVA